MGKVLMFLSDGVSLRNFAYTKLNEISNNANQELVYWNNTIFPLKDTFEFNELKAPQPKINPITDIYKKAKIRIELNLRAKKFKDKRYNTYTPQLSYKGIINSIKSITIKGLELRYSTKRGTRSIMTKMEKLESNTSYFKECVQQLKEQMPEAVFFTSQRAVISLAPMLAAKSLGIKTITFIYSWDNLPKAQLLLYTDYYFVWSDYMKQELINYYPFIDESKVYSIGTPQFEFHFKKDLLETKESFFETHKLNLSKEYICFSGNDITTCPDDPLYLKDLAEIVRKMNKGGKNLGVIFRRCPVDFSNRYDNVLRQYDDVIVPIEPAWKKIKDAWNTIMPTIKDNQILANTIHHSVGVYNLGSSMVFDACLQLKPCIYINYDSEESIDEKWNVKKIYNYIHFDSMPHKDAVIWINRKDEIEDKINELITEPDYYLQKAKKWLNIIVKQPQNEASERISKLLKGL